MRSDNETRNSNIAEGCAPSVLMFLFLFIMLLTIFI